MSDRKVMQEAIEELQRVLSETVEQRDGLLKALEAAEVLFACHCNDATAANWLDMTREAISAVRGAS